MIKVKYYLCPECETWICSRTNHDYSSCDCDSESDTRIGVDAGNIFYGIIRAHRLIGNDFFKRVKTKVVKYPDLTQRDMYDDWNNSTDKYKRLK